jgi:hypothetical protein
MSKIKTTTNTAITAAVIITATVLIVGIIIASTDQLTNKIALAQGAQKKFTTDLSGKNEVPPVDTKASGTAQFQLSADGKQIDYDLTTKDLNGFMMAHIHQGKAGENGQPVAMLTMGKGKITSAELQGALSGKQISDLVKIMEDGNAYVNVHTQQNQNGEIRGQISK